MIRYRSSATTVQSSGTSIAVTLPTSRTIGDLALLVVSSASGSGQTYTAPCQFSLVIRTNDGTSHSQAVYQAVYDGTWDDDQTITLGSSVEATAALILYGGVDQLAPIETSAGQANASSSSATAPTVTTVRGNAMLVALYSALTGARTFTPPSGMTERDESAGVAMAEEFADAIVATPGATGTRVATMSGASVSIGTLLSLAPSMLTTVTQVRDEVAWAYTAWSARLTTEAAMNAFVEGVIQRANSTLKRAVTAAIYADALADDVGYNALLTAELALVQVELLRAAAALTETGDDNAPSPFLGSAKEILLAAKEYERWAREIVTSLNPQALLLGANPRQPAFVARVTTESMIEPFSPVTGLDADPFDAEESG